MSPTKDTLTRRLALAEQIVTSAGGSADLDQLPDQERSPAIAALEQQFMRAEGVGRDVARRWIAKAVRRQRHPIKRSGTAPDTSLYLGDQRRAWLQDQGGIQPTIQRLIDEAMGG